MVQVMDVHQKHSEETGQPVLHVANLDKSYIGCTCLYMNIARVYALETPR